MRWGDCEIGRFFPYRANGGNCYSGFVGSIAVPVYKSYVIKTKIVGPLQIMDKVARDSYQSYQSAGAYPTSVVINGVTVNNGLWTYVNYGSIVGFLYSVNSSGVMVASSIAGLDGIPNYTTPTSGNLSPNNTVITYSLRDISNSVTKAVCGSYSVTSFPTGGVPFAYLPASCACAEVNSFFVNGTGGC